MWSSVATFSATSTGFRIGRSRTDVFRRITPVSGASRASIENGCGHTVGCDSQCWPIETHSNPIREAAATTSIASSMIRVGGRSVGLQKGVR
jgi:hypothetical protein